MTDTLLGMFGQQRAPQVSFDVSTSWQVEDLLVTEDDSLSEIARKMKRCQDIVESGGSLAVALGTLPRDGGPVDYAKAAFDEMAPTEQLQYRAWVEGAQLPPINVEKDRAEAEKSRSARTRDERRLAWLRRAYKNDKLAAENLAFFHKNYSALIPLLCAGAKVIGQERAATNNESRDARHLAEQVAAAKLAGAASARQNVIQAEVARLNLSIASGVQALGARKEAMRPAEGGGKPRNVPANKAREAVGLAPIGPVNKWRKEGAEGRGSRFVSGPSGGESSGTKRKSGEGPMVVDTPALTKKKKSTAAPRSKQGPVAGPSTELPAPATRSAAKTKQPTRRQEASRAASPSYTPQSPPAEGAGIREVVDDEMF
jgi:hypothetical protein